MRDATAEGILVVQADLDRFCNAHYEGLVGALGLYCGDWLLAEELAQETLARVCNNWRRVQRMDQPVAWAYRVGVNLANSHFRRKLAEWRANERMQREAVSFDDVPDAASMIAVRESLLTLPKRQRAVLVLHYYADLPFSQVAKTLQLPEGTVKSLARRGIATLRTRSGLIDLEEEPSV